MKKLLIFWKAYNRDAKRKEKLKEREIKIHGLMKILFSVENTNESIEILKAFNKEAETKLAKIALDSGIVTENVNEYFKNK